MWVPLWDSRYCFVAWLKYARPLQAKQLCLRSRVRGFALLVVRGGVVAVSMMDPSQFANTPCNPWLMCSQVMWSDEPGHFSIAHLHPYHAVIAWCAWCPCLTQHMLRLAVVAVCFLESAVVFVCARAEIKRCLHRCQCHCCASCCKRDFLQELTLLVSPQPGMLQATHPHRSGSHHRVPRP